MCQAELCCRLERMNRIVVLYIYVMRTSLKILQKRRKRPWNNQSFVSICSKQRVGDACRWLVCTGEHYSILVCLETGQAKAIVVIGSYGSK